MSTDFQYSTDFYGMNSRELTPAREEEFRKVIAKYASK